MVRMGRREKTRNPVTKGSNDWESSLWFYKNFDPSDKREKLGWRRLVRRPYLRLRLSEGDTLPFFKP